MFYEELTLNCPPLEAKITEEKMFYRVVRNIPPKEEDFFSHKRLYPNKLYKDICQASALSIFDNFKDCKKITKLPSFKNGECNIGRFILNKNTGPIMKTGNNGHFSWWRTIEFKIESVEVAND